MLSWMDRNPGAAAVVANMLPVELIAPRDVSNAIAWVVSDEAGTSPV